MDRIQLKEYLIDEAEYSSEEVEEMTNSELIDKWLTYEGLIGYTSEILDTIEGVYNVKLKDQWESGTLN